MSLPEIKSRGRDIYYRPERGKSLAPPPPQITPWVLVWPTLLNLSQNKENTIRNTGQHMLLMCVRVQEIFIYILHAF